MITVQSRIVGPKHLAHSAFADLLDDAIRAQALAALHRCGGLWHGRKRQRTSPFVQFSTTCKVVVVAARSPSGSMLNRNRLPSAVATKR